MWGGGGRKALQVADLPRSQCHGHRVATPISLGKRLTITCNALRNLRRQCNSPRSHWVKSHECRPGATCVDTAATLTSRGCQTLSEADVCVGGRLGGGVAHTGKTRGLGRTQAQRQTPREPRRELQGLLLTHLPNYNTVQSTCSSMKAHMIHTTIHFPTTSLLVSHLLPVKLSQW